MDGFGKGAGNILKGVLGGAAIMVTAPIQGKRGRIILLLNVNMAVKMFIMTVIDDASNNRCCYYDDSNVYMYSNS